MLADTALLGTGGGAERLVATLRELGEDAPRLLLVAREQPERPTPPALLAAAADYITLPLGARALAARVDAQLAIAAARRSAGSVDARPSRGHGLTAAPGACQWRTSSATPTSNAASARGRGRRASALARRATTVLRCA